MEIEIETGGGPARVKLDEPGNPRFLLVLTHGAGGGVDSKDLLAARAAGVGLGGAVARVQGGRSNGARLACRTAPQTGAQAVVALAFPLHPPGRPERSRVAELRAAGTDVLVINGASDPFGIPRRADASRVVVLPGETHALARHPEKVGEVVTTWLGEVLALAPGGPAPRPAARASGARSPGPRSGPRELGRGRVRLLFR